MSAASTSTNGTRRHAALKTTGTQTDLMPPPASLRSSSYISLADFGSSRDHRAKRGSSPVVRGAADTALDASDAATKWPRRRRVTDGLDVARYVNNPARIAIDKKAAASATITSGGGGDMVPWLSQS